MTREANFVNLIYMDNLRVTIKDFIDFCKYFYRYAKKKLNRWWIIFETNKDILVDLLIAKRGTYQRPFLHTSVMIIIIVGIVALPVIINTYPTQAAADVLQNYTPSSAILTTLDNQETLTQVSEKPRDTIIAYKVEDGDTLAKIAEKFDVTVDTLKWANASIKGEKLTIGQEISIPPVTGMVIKVQKGETIYSIAKKYKTDPQQILNYPFNDYADLDTFALVAGQTLVVPNGVMPEAAPVYSPMTIAQVGTIPGSGLFMWPTQGAITQRPVSYHMAVDIANSSLPPIMAADAGKVILVEYGRYGYGHHVIIDHGNGYQTLYGHMSEIFVSPGQAVSKASVIGKMGSTGNSSGSHLHFEIRKNGTLLNPLGFLK